jgi:hypothetical protein
LAIIVVQQGKSLPGAGAIRWRLQENGLSENSPKEVIAALFAQEQQNIFYFEHWADVLNDRGLQPYKPELQAIDEVTHGLAKRGTASGESESHLRLKKFVGEHPELVGIPKKAKLMGYEVALPSLDRADLVFEYETTIYPIEIKSEEVDALEFIRGIYQVIKYQSLFSAQEKDRGRSMRVESRLVCGRLATEAETLRCLLLGVSLFQGIES